MNNLKWKKGGKIFDPTGRSDWMNTHAQNPNAIELEDRIRIYFTCRPKPDEDGKFVSLIGFADFTKDGEFDLIDVSKEPVISLGGPGDFDEFGTMPGSIVVRDDLDEIWLYYVGWTRMQSVPYKWSNGLAISKDGGVTFSKFSKGPIIPSTFFDPYLQACPRVHKDKDGRWHMYYQSGTTWNKVGEKFESVYITRQGFSHDGVHWETEPDIIIPTIVPDECQTSATYFEHNGTHHMFFSYRHGIDFRNKDKGYRIGYMRSHDGMTWARNDADGGLLTSESGWDEEMVCYPGVLKLNGKIYMFYCGNGFGIEGFGVAELIS